MPVKKYPDRERCVDYAMEGRGRHCVILAMCGGGHLKLFNWSAFYEYCDTSTRRYPSNWQEMLKYKYRRCRDCPQERRKNVRFYPKRPDELPEHMQTPLLLGKTEYLKNLVEDDELQVDREKKWWTEVAIGVR